MNGLLEALQNPAVWAGVLGASALSIWGLPVQAALRRIRIGLLGLSIVLLVIARQEYTIAGIGHLDATAAILSAYCIACVIGLIAISAAGPYITTAVGMESAETKED
jgi:hypothetical protein